MDNKRLRIILMVCSAIVMLSLFTAGVALYDRFGQTNEKRAAQARLDARQTQAFVNLLCFVQSFPPAHALTPAEQESADKFFAGAFKSIGGSPKSCLPTRS